MNTGRFSSLLVIPALAVMAGCSTPTVLSLDGRACDAAPTLSRDNQVELGSSRGTTVALDGTARCVMTPAGPATYAVFALPEVASPYRITVRSTLRGQSVIWPDATVYGRDDRPRLHIDSLREAAGAVVGSVTGQVGDRYVVVTSTPGTIGRREAIPTAAATPPIRLAATIIIPIVIPNGPVGPATNKLPAILAHSGRITVTALPFVSVP